MREVVIIEGFAKNAGVWRILVPSSVKGIVREDLILDLSKKVDTSDTISFFEKWKKEGDQKKVTLYQITSYGDLAKITLMEGCRFIRKCLEQPKRYYFSVEKVHSSYPQY